jgi:membrane fusion protein (multidrug efflux system)
MKRSLFLSCLLVPLSVGLVVAGVGCGGGSDARAQDEGRVAAMEAAEGGAASAGSSSAERVATVRTQSVESEEVSDLVVLSADLLPLRRATLAAEVAGVVDEVHVELGDAVPAGRVLARIDTRALHQQLAEAEAICRNAIDRAERAEKLFEKRSITERQRLDAIAERDVAQARLASAELVLSKSALRAPWAGRVAAKRVEVGDYAIPGQQLFELVAVERLKVSASAPAADVPFLEVGRSVTVTVDFLPGRSFSGRVMRLGAELDPDSRTLAVEAEIDNADGSLRPGMFGRMQIPRRVLPDALLVPLSAVVEFEAGKSIYVVEAGRAVRREVDLGPVLGERVVVQRGLGAGERVVVSGQRQVADGQRVEEAAGS